MTDEEKLQRAHNDGEKYESERRIDPVDALARTFYYSRAEQEAFEEGRENVRNQRAKNND